MIGNITQFWRLTRELNIGELRERLEQPVSIRVLGSNGAVAQRVARLIEPDPLAGEVTAAVLGDNGRERADLFVVALDDSLEPSARRVLSDLSVGETPMVLVQAAETSSMVVLGVPQERIITLQAQEGDDEVRDRLFTTLVQAAPEIMLAAGRRHPLLREPVAEHLIRDTSRVNGQFAALASLPATLPFFGGLVGDVADMLILTKNQVLLLFKLGGLYGRDLTLGLELLLEVVPVVGGAFFWRTTARTLVGLVPPAIGILPKTLIAYAGTYVVGEMARYYFRYGHKPPPEVVRELSAEGARIARETLIRLRGG
ncbi:MAG TPA: hypothetical protein VFG86_06395 [Chloroflexota bacterium]|nr:hypothetical protein [Chloroflexota bacterium]